MVNNKNTPAFQNLHGLLDIEAPIAPPASNTPVVMTSVAFVLLLTTLLIFTIRYFNNPRVKARRQLKLLQLKNTQRIERNAAFQFANILSYGLGLNGITSTTPLPAILQAQNKRWLLFTTRLSALRFADEKTAFSNAGIPNNGKLNSQELFDEADFWLKNWP